jgi:hypothetical protein
LFLLATRLLRSWMPERLRRSRCEPALFRGSARVTPVRCAVWAAQLLCVFSEALGLNRICAAQEVFGTQRPDFASTLHSACFAFYGPLLKSLGLCPGLLQSKTFLEIEHNVSSWMVPDDFQPVRMAMALIGVRKCTIRASRCIATLKTLKTYNEITIHYNPLIHCKMSKL